MSETAALEMLQKKRTDMENHWSSQLEKHKNLEGNIKELEEKVQAQLQQKIKTEDAALDTLESKRKELENRLQQLQDHQETSQNPTEPTPQVTETQEQPQAQPPETTSPFSSDNDQTQNPDTRERHREDRRRR